MVLAGNLGGTSFKAKLLQIFETVSKDERPSPSPKPEHCSLWLWRRIGPFFLAPLPFDRALKAGISKTMVSNIERSHS